MNDIQLDKSNAQDPKRIFSKKGQLLNEWESLTALSNRRLNMESFPTPFLLSWSIDRITIVGRLNDSILYHSQYQSIFIDFEQLMRINEGEGYLEAVNSNSWKLTDQYGENIAYIEILKFQKGYGRIDFNPNKINKYVATSMKNFIHDLFLDPHFSRADIACDIIDVPDDFITQYTVVDPVSYRPYYGRSGKLESAYWGSRSSERQIRMYNKKLEQQVKRKIVPSEISTWWRIELQLRRGKASDWYDMVNETLDSFSSPHYLPIDIKHTDKIMIMGLLSDHSLWHGLSPKTKYKYRDILKRETQNDELTNYLRQTFKESASELKNELDTWLLGLNVKEDESNN